MGKGMPLFLRGLLPLWIALAALCLTGPIRAVADNAALSAPVFPDIDAMASRMKKDQDLYRKIRDEALAGYAQRNPQPHPYDEKVKTVLRLQAYLCVWADFYGEGLWQRGNGYAAQALAEGAGEPSLTEFQNIVTFSDVSSSTEADAEAMMSTADQILTGAYPASFKLKACLTAIDDLSNFRSNHHPDNQSPSMKARAHFVEAWGNAYREMLKQTPPHSWLYVTGDQLQHAAQADKETLDLVIAEQDRAFNEVDPQNPVKQELDGDYFINAAWCARGSGYANTVSDQGWDLFRHQLAAAATILEPLYDLYPKEVNICKAMMTVELGQGQGRDRMELWFHRGIQADPDDYGLYKSKEWYLLPRWYGTVDDITAFGHECVAGGNWSSKIPMILPVGIAESSSNEGTIYSDPKVWATLDIVYREYLSRYPDAIFFRTNYAKHAFDSGHLDVAREQFKILGQDWDSSVLSSVQVEEIRAQLAK